MKKRRSQEESISIHDASEHKLENKLAQNLIELQKLNVKMIEKFDKLTEQISSLLGLFEMTAKSFGENPAYQVSEKDKEFLEKIDKLLEQNKTIAKGLVMMEERIREKVYSQNQQVQERPNSADENNLQPSLGNRPLPRY